ncbi:MAG: hypothetical protein AAGE59_11165 [Cyanobacteria bacterium P01_F01_bin.86]
MAISFIAAIAYNFGCLTTSFQTLEAPNMPISISCIPFEPVEVRLPQRAERTVLQGSMNNLFCCELHPLPDDQGKTVVSN